MIEVKFSTEMIKILKEMIGRDFCSYDCENLAQNASYGNLQINLDTHSIEFLNEVKGIPFFNLIEDISGFSCKKKSLNEAFQPYCSTAPHQKHLVNEKILDVYVVNDNISVNSGEYDICFDMALIIQTNNHKYIISRGWFFAETIYISKDKSFDDVYPIGKVIEDWADDDKNTVDVVRTVRKL